MLSVLRITLRSTDLSFIFEVKNLKKSTVIFLISSIAVILVLCIGVGFILMSNRTKSNSNSASNSEIPLFDLNKEEKTVVEKEKEQIAEDKTGDISSGQDKDKETEKTQKNTPSVIVVNPTEKTNPVVQTPQTSESKNDNADNQEKKSEEKKSEEKKSEEEKSEEDKEISEPIAIIEEDEDTSEDTSDDKPTIIDKPDDDVIELPLIEIE